MPSQPGFVNAVGKNRAARALEPGPHLNIKGCLTLGLTLEPSHALLTLLSSKALAGRNPG